MGIPTLIVDLDPQANATSSLGFEKTGRGIYEPLLSGSDRQKEPSQLEKTFG